MMDEWHEFKKRLLTDPETREAYESRKPAYELASKLIQLRNSLGLTQRQIATKARMTQPEIARLESGGADPNWDTLRRVLSALGASLEIKARGPDGKLVRVTLEPAATVTDRRRKSKPEAKAS